MTSCDICQEYRNQQEDASPIPYDIPITLSTKVDTDLFELKGKSYIAVADYSTNFFYISLIPNKRPTTVVTHTKRNFSKFGISKKFTTDNGP